MKRRHFSLFALAAAGVVLLSTVPPCTAQTIDQRIDQAIDLLVNQGEWDAAIDELSELLESRKLAAQQRRKALKFLAIGYVFDRNEGQAVSAFKKLVLANPDFTIDDLSIDGQEPSSLTIRYFGEAVVKVRQEEIEAYNAQMLRTSRKSAFLRSLVLPGWGQRYQGYRGRGIALLAMTTLSIGYATWAEIKYQDARDTYDKAGESADFEKLYTDYKDKGDMADRTLLLIGGLWTLNIVDAAVQEPNIIRQKVGLQPSPRGDGIQLVYLKRF